MSFDQKVKVKFEPLIAKPKTRTNITKVANGVQKRNFKKFQKIPKAVGSLVRDSAVVTSKFKSVKQENFDLDSQFNDFMNSMHR